MEKFLEIVYTHYIQTNTVENVFDEKFKPFLDRLEVLVGLEVLEELIDLLSQCAYEDEKHFAVMGMQLALDILNGKEV